MMRWAIPFTQWVGMDRPWTGPMVLARFQVPKQSIPAPSHPWFCSPCRRASCSRGNRQSEGNTSVPVWENENQNHYRSWTLAFRSKSESALPTVLRHRCGPCPPMLCGFDSCSTSGSYRFLRMHCEESSCHRWAASQHQGCKCSLEGLIWKSPASSWTLPPARSHVRAPGTWAVGWNPTGNSRLANEFGLSSTSGRVKLSDMGKFSLPEPWLALCFPDILRNNFVLAHQRYLRKQGARKRALAILGIRLGMFGGVWWILMVFVDFFVVDLRSCAAVEIDN